MPALVGDPGFLRHIRKSPVAVVAVERVARALHPARPAEHFKRSIQTVPAAAELGQLGEIILNVVRDEQIQIAVAVIIGPAARARPARVSDARLPGHLGEGPVAVIPVEHVRPEVGQIDVRVAVPVVIRNARAHAPAAKGDAGMLRNVGEGPVALVVVQTVGRQATGPERLNRRGVGEIDVKPAVLVVIDESHAAAHRLDQISLLRRRDALQLQPGSVSHVFKINLRFGMLSLDGPEPRQRAAG